MNNITTVREIATKLLSDEELGRIAIKQQGPYILLNYTENAYRDGNMTEIEQACRGLVIRDDGHIVALPISKFFNLGEPQCPPLPDEPYTVLEKVDGSLGIFWYDGQRWQCNTRGSFDNAYTDFALQWWNENVESVAFPQSWTVMVEICFDDDEMNRAVQHEEGLYLIAIRDRITGRDVSIFHREVFDLGHGLLLTSYVQSFIDDLLEKRDQEEDTEGWVVRFESGFRVKIKTAWYLKLFKAMQYLTPKNIRELMLDGENWIADFPDDLQPDAIHIRDAIVSLWRDKLASIEKAYAKLKHIETRKNFALMVMRDYREISSYLFQMRDGRFSERVVLEKLDFTLLP